MILYCNIYIIIDHCPFLYSSSVCGMNFLNQRVKFLYLNLQTVAAYTELKATKFLNRGGLEIPLAALRLSYTYNVTYL